MLFFVVVVFVFYFIKIPKFALPGVMLKFERGQYCSKKEKKGKKSPPVIFLTVSMPSFFCRSFLLLMFHVCYAFLSVQCSLVVTCWERANLLALLCVVFCCDLSLSREMSWVGCGA